MTAISQVSQTTAQAQPAFDRDLSLRIDAMVKAVDAVTAWPEGEARRECMAVLDARLAQLKARVPA